MTRPRLSTLQALRIYGPCSARQLSELGHDTFDIAISKAEAMVDRGLARQLPSGQWELTEAGVEALPARVEAPAERALKLAEPPPRPTTRRSWPYGGGAA
jgi:hypothetical protein